MSDCQGMKDRDLLELANEIIGEMVSMLAHVKAPPANADFRKKFDSFYLEAFSIANARTDYPQDDIVLSVLDELNGGTLQ